MDQNMLELNQKIDLLASQVAYLAEQAQRAELSRQSRDELLETVMPIARDGMAMVANEMQDVPRSLAHGMLQCPPGGMLQPGNIKLLIFDRILKSSLDTPLFICNIKCIQSIRAGADRQNMKRWRDGQRLNRPWNFDIPYYGGLRGKANVSSPGPRVE